MQTRLVQKHSIDANSFFNSSSPSIVVVFVVVVVDTVIKSYTRIELNNLVHGGNLKMKTNEKL